MRKYQNWVSVKDKLPKSGKNVLVHEHDGSMSIRYLPTNGREAWYPGGMGIGWTTHWMELPEAPDDYNRRDQMKGVICI